MMTYRQFKDLHFYGSVIAYLAVVGVSVWLVEPRAFASSWLPIILPVGLIVWMLILIVAIQPLYALYTRVRTRA